MSRSSVARFVVVLLVVATLTTPASWSAPLRLPDETSSFDILARVWNSFLALLAKEGCNIDPHGLCVYKPSPTAEAGCTIDPHGGCAEVQGSTLNLQPRMEAGCGADPHGGCTLGN